MLSKLRITQIKVYCVITSLKIKKKKKQNSFVHRKHHHNTRLGKWLVKRKKSKTPSLSRSHGLCTCVYVCAKLFFHIFFSFFTKNGNNI